MRLGKPRRQKTALALSDSVTRKLKRQSTQPAAYISGRSPCSMQWTSCITQRILLGQEQQTCTPNLSFVHCASHSDLGDPTSAIFYLFGVSEPRRQSVCLGNGVSRSVIPIEQLNKGCNCGACSVEEDVGRGHAIAIPSD